MEIMITDSDWRNHIFPYDGRLSTRNALLERFPGNHGWAEFIGNTCIDCSIY